MEVSRKERRSGSRSLGNVETSIPVFNNFKKPPEPQIQMNGNPVNMDSIKKISSPSKEILQQRLNEFKQNSTTSPQKTVQTNVALPKTQITLQNVRVASPRTTKAQNISSPSGSIASPASTATLSPAVSDRTVNSPLRVSSPPPTSQKEQEINIQNNYQTNNEPKIQETYVQSEIKPTTRSEKHSSYNVVSPIIASPSVGSRIETATIIKQGTGSPDIYREEPPPSVRRAVPPQIPLQQKNSYEERYRKEKDMEEERYRAYKAERDIEEQKNRREREINEERYRREETNERTPQKRERGDNSGILGYDKQYEGTKYKKFKEMTEDELKVFNKALRNDFEKLTNLYPSYVMPKINPDNNDPAYISEMLEVYDRKIEYLEARSTTKIQKTIFIIICYMVEKAASKYIKEDILKGFTENQIRTIARYDRLFMKLTGKGFFSFTESWPIPLQVCFFTLIDAVVILLVNYLGEGPISKYIKDVYGKFMESYANESGKIEILKDKELGIEDSINENQQMSKGPEISGMDISGMFTGGAEEFMSELGKLSSGNTGPKKAKRGATLGV